MNRSDKMPAGILEERMKEVELDNLPAEETTEGVSCEIIAEDTLRINPDPETRERGQKENRGFGQRTIHMFIKTRSVNPAESGDYPKP